MIRSTFALAKLIAPGLLVLVAAAQVHAGGCRRSRRAARCAPAPACAAACRPAPAFGYAPAAAPGQAPAVDAGSFAGWLNAERAARGLSPCSLDAGLCADAAANSRLGFGHGFMGRARRQNAGLGPLPDVCAGWVASPAHADALFDPTISRVGLGQAGDVVTFAAN